ncbi:MAG: PPC domain-containing protein [Armatimonadota bacterium]|nr:PPC domain-containing protein [Armatimonadota bacterium]
MKIPIPLLLLTSGLILPTAVMAAPQLDWIYPAGAQRGSAVTVELHGSGLSHLDGVFSTGTGLTLDLLPPKAGGRNGNADTFRTARITLNQNADLGNREVRLYDSTGLSAPKIFQVDQWPEVQETEPNNDPAKANEIPLPVVINGRLEGSADVDCYRFHAKAGQPLTCSVASERLLSNIGELPVEGFLELLDETGKVVAENNGRSGWDPIVNFTPPADGVYTVRLRDLLWRNAPTAVYRLTVGPVPFAATFFPAGGQRGSTVHPAVTGYNLEGATTTVVIPPGDPETIRPVRATGPLGLSNPVPFGVGNYPEIMEQEPNDTVEQAEPVPMPVTINGKLDHDGDRDRFRFHADKGQRLVLEVFASRLGSPLDSVIALRDPQGNLINENDDAKDKDSLLDFTFPAAGDYTVVIRDVDLRGGPDYTYRLSIGPPHPTFTLSVSPDTLAAPPGGAVRLDVKVQREQGFNGPVRVHIEDLPPGIRASTTVIPPGSDRGILTVEGGVAAPAPPAVPRPQPVKLAGATTHLTAATPAIAAPAPVAPASRPIALNRPTVVRIIGDGDDKGTALTRTAVAMETYYYQGSPQQRPVTGPVALLVGRQPLQLGASTGSIAMNAGSDSRFTVRINQMGSDVKPFTFLADGLPPGVTIEPPPAVVKGAAQVVVIHAAPDAAGAETDFVVSAIPAGERDKRSTPIALAVTPAIHLKLTEITGFGVAAEPAILPVATGKTATLRVKLFRRGGYTGPVDITVTGLPTGMTSAGAKIDAGKTTASIAVLVAPSAPPLPTGKPLEIHVEASGLVGTQRVVRASEVVKLEAE